MSSFVLPVFMVFEGRDADQTRRLYAELESYGTMGAIAVNVLRACKKSTLAKVYRGGNSHGSYKRQSYDQKQWAIEQLVKLLLVHASARKVLWGWKKDSNVLFGQEASWVLYVDLPFGKDENRKLIYRQVSYHSPTRGLGPDYLGEWDGKLGHSNQVAIDFAEYVRKVATEKAARKAERAAAVQEAEDVV